MKTAAATRTARAIEVRGMVQGVGFRPFVWRLAHRYDVAGDGTIRVAKIVPPTSQNLSHIEEDLRLFIPGFLDRSDQELGRLCEMVVRTYDPCISCATHFLRLDVERV